MDGTSYYAQNLIPSLKTDPEEPQFGLNFFINSLKIYNDKLPASRKQSNDDYAYLHTFLTNIINDQNKRAAEVASDGYKEILKTALSYFPYATYFLMCAGGRNDPLYTNGITYGIMERVRIPEKFLKDFVRDSNGKLQLLEHSPFAKLIENAFEKSDIAVFVVDSHIECAARVLEEVNRGENPQDNGLHTDIIQKTEMIDAMNRYITEQYTSKKGIFIQISFNPKTGFMYVGLETLNALIYATGIARGKAEVHGKNPECTNPEYADDVREFLMNRDVILSTAALVKEPEIKEIFAREYFDIDWKNNYVQSAKQFWDRITKMKDHVFPYIKPKLTHIYPKLSDEKEIDIRALLVLTNAFNGYLHTPTQVDTNHNEKENEQNYQCEYSSHREEGIMLSHADFPPHEIAMVIIPDNNIHTSVEWGARIIRKNRLRTENPVTDSTKTYKTHDDYIKAPIPIVVEGIVSDSLLDESDWKVLEAIVWNDLPDTCWNTCSDNEFAKYLEDKKEKLSLSIANGIMELRRRMKKFYTPGHDLFVDVTEQTKVVLPILTDESGKVRAIIPFLKFGS